MCCVRWEKKERNGKFHMFAFRFASLPIVSYPFFSLCFCFKLDKKRRRHDPVFVCIKIIVHSVTVSFMLLFYPVAVVDKILSLL